MDAYSHYRSQAVETAGPAQLVLMLYDGAIAALHRARLAEGAETVNRELLKAQDIVEHLQGTLDRTRGGQIAGNLYALYAFCLERLLEANLRKELAALDDVEPVLVDLRDAWATACCGAVPAAVAS